jgi:hypothetical protein
MTTLATMVADAPPVDFDQPDGALPLRLLNDETSIDREAADAAGAARIFVPLAGLVVLGFAMHAVAVIGVAWGSLGPLGALQHGIAWFGAATLGFFASISAGLPSYWFYGVVAKIRAPAWRLAVELVRVQAVGSVVLAGIVPFWLAWSLGLHLVLGIEVFDAPPWMAVTYALPFLCATPGLLGLYRVFCRMRDAVGESGWLPPVALTARWMVLFVYTTPVTLWALFHAFA